MKFSIITPSFRNSAYLKLCIASVADQTGVEVEHIVQDSCSDDSTQEWLPHDPRVKAYIEKDTGMYDAVNRGFDRAKGDVLAYLNCDEQYLPGALAAVGEYFTQHPEVDVVVSDTVVVDGQGDYVCHRYSFAPTAGGIWIRFAALTCALFMRRKVLSEWGVRFDTKWRDLGDFFYVEHLARKGARFGELRRMVAVFADTGENMNMKPNAVREKLEKRAMVPLASRLLRPWYLARHLWQKFRSGAVRQPPFDFEAYTLASPSARVSQHVTKTIATWPGRSATVPVPPAK
jgi:glycosyltransferase involved in cell wall biosynthesis